MALSERYSSALVWAAELHRDQVRKGTGIPYLAHLIGVSGLVLEHGGDEDQAIAGLLHDSIEDQGVADSELADRYGERVQRIVRACTDSDVIPKPPWPQRKATYIAHLAHAPSEALLVSLADKVHNARAIASDVARVGDAYFDVFTGKAEGTRWYYRRLHAAFASRIDELPGEEASAGGPTLLRALETAITSFGATEEAAASYERR